MNRVFIIGNLTRDPELRVTSSGDKVCSFVVAVNRRKTQSKQNPEADFFRVTAWRDLGENCAKYLAKGRKVAVSGPVSVSSYTSDQGKTYVNLEVLANDVEFLTPKDAQPVQTHPDQASQSESESDQSNGYTPVDMGDDELPF